MPDAAHASGAAASLPAGAIPTDRVELRTGTLVVTDLHLAPMGDARTDKFVAWCDGLGEVPALVCLGDLFDMWVSRQQVRLPGSVPVFEAFRRLTERGVAVHLVPGNRDLLIGRWFDAKTGGTLHPDGFVASVEGDGEVAFVHGDALCTLDRGYLRLRWAWRFGLVRLFSWLAPLWVSRRIGARVRGVSDTAKPLKLPAEKSIQADAVRAVAAATGVRTVVCGHAHEFRDDSLERDGAEPVRWVVVGAWEWTQDLLRVTNGGGLELDSSATIPAAT